MHELIHEVSKYALKMGEEWRCGEGTEMMDALQAAHEEISFPRVWAMPNRYTFSIPPIKALLMDEVGCEEWLHWVDPFAGMNSPAGVTNDIDLLTPATNHLDALEFLQTVIASEMADGVLFDPPYSVEQAKRAYKMKGFGGSVGFEIYIQQCKDEIARIVKPSGKVITFGWNSSGMGMKRGFKLVRGLLICHGGGGHRDTIVTVEVKQ